MGHHFAGHSNRFWKLLFDSGMVDEPLSFREDWRLPEWRLGLTNIIDPAEYRAKASTLERKIRRYQPRIIALLGVTIFRILFPEITRSSRLALGPTPARLAGIRVFLLPNPSGRNAHYPYRVMLDAFALLRRQADE
jgi:TDG/mug DNA glycosylase family protein